MVPHQSLISEARAKVEECRIQLNAILRDAKDHELTDDEKEAIRRLHLEIATAVEELLRQTKVMSPALVYLVAAGCAWFCSAGLALFV